MKVKKIIPCICTDHEATTADSVFYGMPRLYVYDCSKGQRYSACCPECGRGLTLGDSDYGITWVAYPYDTLEAVQAGEGGQDGN